MLLVLLRIQSPGEIRLNDGEIPPRHVQNLEDLHNALLHQIQVRYLYWIQLTYQQLADNVQRENTEIRNLEAQLRKRNATVV